MANDEHVALVRRGTKAINAFAEQHDDVSLDLRDVDLHGSDLRGAQLKNAKLRGADLSECDLRDAALNSSDMRQVNLRDADLRNANLHRAVLTGADLRGVKLSPLSTGSMRMCISPQTFDGVQWERDELERVLQMINLNPDYEVRYEIVPRST